MRAVIRVTAAMALAVGLGGCAMSLTDFKFPSFGLTSKDKADDATLPPEQRQSSSLAQQQ